MPISSDIGSANRIGAIAQAWLARGDRSGRVFAVVSEAAYLIGADDTVIWLAQEKAPLHPRVLRGALDFRALSAGMPFKQQGAFLEFTGAGGEASPVGTVGWADASVWRPLAISPAPRAKVRARWLQLLQALAPPSDGDGFGLLLPVLQEIAAVGNATLAARTGPFVSAAAPAFVEVARACRNRAPERVLAAGRALVGLGPGLTPSGDDFMGGLLFVVDQLKAAFPEELGWGSIGLDEWLAWARPRTNTISYAILASHAAGQSVEPMHTLVGALLGDRLLDEILTAVRAVLAIGSTSGWDMLMGLLVGMLLLGGRSQPGAAPDSAPL